MYVCMYVFVCNPTSLCTPSSNRSTLVPTPITNKQIYIYSKMIGRTTIVSHPIVTYLCQTKWHFRGTRWTQRTTAAAAIEMQCAIKRRTTNFPHWPRSVPARCSENKVYFHRASRELRSSVVTIEALTKRARAFIHICICTYMYGQTYERKGTAALRKDRYYLTFDWMLLEEFHKYYDSNNTAHFDNITLC